MLGKLLKYDLKWLYKGLIPFYIIASIFSIITRGLKEVENSFILNIISQICMGIVIAMLVNILVNTMIRAWVRTITNMYKDESYLTHTLPVSRKHIFTSKIVSAILTMFTSTLVILLCVLICFYSKINIEQIKQFLEGVSFALDSSVIGFLSVMIVVLFLEFTFMIIAGCIGIILGYKSNNLKLVKSVIAGLLLFMIPSVFTLLVLFIAGFFNPDIMNLFNTITTLNVDVLKSVLYIGIVMYVCYILFYYMIGCRLLNKGVDIE